MWKWRASGEREGGDELKITKWREILGVRIYENHCERICGAI